MQRLFGIPIALCLCLVAPPSHAVSLSVEVLKCAAFEVKIERLDCFDALADLVANSKVVSIPVEDLGARASRSAAEDDFGVKKTSRERLSAEITQLQKLARGQYQLTLDNQQVWREIEPNSRARYAVGELVTIERTLLGAFRLRVESTGFTNKVTRLR